MVVRNKQTNKIDIMPREDQKMNGKWGILIHKLTTLAQCLYTMILSPWVELHALRPFLLSGRTSIQGQTRGDMLMETQVRTQGSQKEDSSNHSAIQISLRWTQAPKTIQGNPSKDSGLITHHSQVPTLVPEIYKLTEFSPSYIRTSVKWQLQNQPWWRDNKSM